LIRRILDALEANGGREVYGGLDARGEPAWSLQARELLAAVGAWQAELRDRGVRPGDRVGIDLPRGPELLPAHVATLAAGATVVPMNAALSGAERKRVLEKAELRTLLAPGERPRRGGVPQLSEAPADSPALLIFTSGTTGEPKGVPLRELQLEANLDALAQAWGLSAADRLLHVLPCHHLHGLVLALYGSARLGTSITLLERFDADLCVRALETQKASVFMGVPTMLRRMARSELSVELDCVRLFVSGSAPLAPQDFRDFETRFGHTPLERYGLSETMIVATNPLEGERRCGSVGRPLPNTEVRLAEDGEIEVRGPALMSGYWQAPELTREAFHEGFFRTGDLGRYDEAGYLCITGRKRELILVGGTNVLPGEVERVLAGDPAVEEVCVAGLPDPDRGEVVAAFVVPRPGHDAEVLEGQLRGRAQEGLASYKQPRVYRFVRALPRNAMGKVDRRALTRPPDV